MLEKKKLYLSRLHEGIRIRQLHTHNKSMPKYGVDTRTCRVYKQKTDIACKNEVPDTKQYVCVAYF